MSKIDIRHISKAFTTGAKQVLALADINLEVQANEFVALVGASGCGKSTLLRIVGGLELQTAGEVLIDGRLVYGPGTDRAMIFQDYSLYPWLSVIDNVRFCRNLKAHRDPGNSLTEVYAAIGRAHGLVELMGLTDYENAYPNQLSGGMRQRVAIARALMSRPQVLLMDEPFGALDAQTREVMHDLILHLFELERSTILSVTHDVEEAIYLADRVVVLAPRPGRVDSIHRVPLPPRRELDMKMSAEVLDLKRTLLHRIRETSGMRTDQGLLDRLTGLQTAEIQ